MPPFMPPPFLDPMITDEQHMPAQFPAFADPTGGVAVSVFDPSLEPIPNDDSGKHPQGPQSVENGAHDELDDADEGHDEQTTNGEEKAAIKRALRACSNCRKDKTRCNGERPCTGCVKKGFKAHECIDGCTYCRKMRLRCLGGQPCANCAEVGAGCVEERETERRTGPPLNRNVSVLDFSTTTNTPAQSGTTIEDRHRNRPTNLKIHYSQHPPSLEATSPIYPSATSGQGVTVIQNADGSVVQIPLYLTPITPALNEHGQEIPGFPPLRPLAGPSRPRGTGQDRAKTACFSCRRDNKKCSNTRPCDRCLQRGEKCTEIEKKDEEQPRSKMRCKACRRDNKKCKRKEKAPPDAPCDHCLSIGEPCEEVPRKGRGSGSRVKVACVGCRRDKIQCEEMRPCRNCVRKCIRCLERACTACNGTGEGDGEGGKCPICRERVAINEDPSMMIENRLSHMTEEHLNVLYPNIAPQLQGPHQHQITHSHPPNFDQMHLAVMGNHPQRYPLSLPPPLPPPDSPEAAQAYHQMMTLAHQQHHSSTSAHASLTHTPVQTPTHSRPPSPRRNISSVRFDGDMPQHQPVMHLPS